ncbi:MAG: NAD(P)/FAD-dependent oxidoreductase [Sphingobacteriia bacterium]|nr:NAD(P)/FAD-dependent oxidoreductase [Sphingobacteriia bacterium]
MQKEYDYVILGGGWGGCAIGSLLAKKGKSVCLIEANNELGGHAYTMTVGEYSFCHDVQYLMGCQKGGPMHVFLRKIGLDKKILFNKMDSKSYDLINIINKKIDIPLGLDNYRKELVALYPKYAKNLERYFNIERKIVNEAHGYEKVLTKNDIIKAPWKYLTIIKYINYTLGDIFDKFGFPQELRAILAGRIGNLSASPKEVSFLMYAAMDVAYADSAFFPKKGMENFINEIRGVIESNTECKILLNTKVTAIKINEDNMVDHIKTTNGQIKGRKYISNLDPHLTFILADKERLPKKYAKKLKYNYSDSIFCIYLGLKGISLKEHGFKKRNIWHHGDFDLDKEYWKEIKNDNFSHPWLFISAPSLLTDKGVLCPIGHETLEILTFANHNHFKKLFNSNRAGYKERVSEIYNAILDVVEKNYIPEIRKYIDKSIVHTPVDMEKILNIPKGNVYGCRVTPKNFNYNRITSETPISNLHLVGASASFPGIMGVTVGALDLLEKLEN